MTQKQLIIQAKMANEEEFLKKCVLLIFGQQEADEKTAKHTHYDNGMGFNKADASFLSEMAIVYKNAWDLVIPSVAAQQIPEVRKRIAKYAGQLTNLVHDNEL